MFEILMARGCVFNSFVTFGLRTLLKKKRLFLLQVY